MAKLGIAERYVVSRFVTYVGNSVYASVGPLLAAVMFSASPAQIGLISASSIAVNTVLRLPAASLVDRARDERLLMVTWGLLAAVVSLAVPLLWIVGWLTFWTFLVCIMLSAASASILGSAGFRVVNAVATEGQRTRVSGLLNGAQSAGSVVGQSGGGALVGLIAPPLAMLLDAATSIIGVLLLPRFATTAESQTGTPLPASQLDRGSHSWSTILRATLRRQNLLIAITLSVAGSVLEPVVVLFLLRNVGLATSLVGLALGFGAVGGVLGGLSVGKVVSRCGPTMTIFAGTVLMAVGTGSLVTLSDIPGTAFISAVIFELLTAGGGVLIIATVMGGLQESTGPAVIARTMSIAALSLELTGLLGVGIGSVIAEVTNLKVPIYVALGIYALALLWVGLRLIRRSSTIGD